MRFTRREYLGEVVGRFGDDGKFTEASYTVDPVTGVVSASNNGLSSLDCILPQDYDTLTNACSVAPKDGKFTVGAGTNLYQDSGVFLINPGSAKTFPWLADCAKHFEFFRINKVSFEYVPVSNGITDKVTPGTVIMGFRQDVLKRPYNSKMDFLEAGNSYVFKASDHATYHCSVKNGGHNYQVKKANYLFDFKSSGLAGQDLKEYFPGMFQIAVIGPENSRPSAAADYEFNPLPIRTNNYGEDLPAETVTTNTGSTVSRAYSSTQKSSLDNRIRFGELYVHYDISLFNPKSATDRGIAMSS